MNLYRIPIFFLLFTGEFSAAAAELRFGAATVDITPSEPVALDGQRRVRISRQPETPISATALALESRAGEMVLHQAVMVSCDLVVIRVGIAEKVRDKVRARLPDLDVRNIFLSATHTHTAPVTVGGQHVLPTTGIMSPAAYADWMTSRVADAIVEAWQRRAPGKVGWGQSQAVIAQNRRIVYADGSVEKGRKTGVSDFRGIEGYEDHNLDALYFWDPTGRLVATAINVPCPAQEVGGVRRSTQTSGILCARRCVRDTEPGFTSWPGPARRAIRDRT